MAKKPRDDEDPPKKEQIDILGIEMDQKLPHWLSPSQSKKGLSPERQKEIRDKHRARYLEEQKAKRK